MTLEDLDMALATLPSGLPKDEKTARRLAHLRTVRNEARQLLGSTGQELVQRPRGSTLDVVVHD